MVVYVSYLLLGLTAPGIILHELAHKQMVEDLGLSVQSVCLFQLDDPAGYVTHDDPQNYLPMFAIAVAPLLLNSAVSYTGFVYAGYQIRTVGIGSLTTLEHMIVALGLWAGISAGVHALPSQQDVGNICRKALENKYSPYVLLGLPVVAGLYALAKTKKYGSNLVFTAGIGYFAVRFIGLML